jgi:hypothetical protein
MTNQKATERDSASSGLMPLQTNPEVGGRNSGRWPLPSFVCVHRWLNVAIASALGVLTGSEPAWADPTPAPSAARESAIDPASAWVHVADERSVLQQQRHGEWEDVCLAPCDAGVPWAGGVFRLRVGRDWNTDTFPLEPGVPLEITPHHRSKGLHTLGAVGFGAGIASEFVGGGLLAQCLEHSCSTFQDIGVTSVFVAGVALALVGVALLDSESGPTVTIAPTTRLAPSVHVSAGLFLTPAGLVF